MTHEYMKEVQSPDDIPQFSSEAEEAEFWATHSLGEWFLDQMEPMPKDMLPSVRPQATPLSGLLDDFTIGRLKELAYRRNVDYKTLITEFIIDRLDEEEKREGVPVAGQVVDTQAPPQAGEQRNEPRKGDWQQQAFDYVKENKGVIEDEDLDYIVSARVLNDASSLLLEISNAIKAASKKEKFPPVRLQRMMKGYNKLKEFIDRAFEVHDEKFGLPEPEAVSERGEAAISGEDEVSEEDDEALGESVSKDNGATVSNIQEAMRKRQRAAGVVEPPHDKGAM